MLVDFKIIPISNKNIFKETVNQVVSYVNSPNPEELANVLEKRFDETHLAIPETKMGQLHVVHKAVEKPLFQIFELEKEIQVVAMNNKMININRIFLLLSPPDVAEYSAYFIGKISSSIVENKLYTKIYGYGNYEVVIELLRQIMEESIKKYGE